MIIGRILDRALEIGLPTALLALSILLLAPTVVQAETLTRESIRKILREELELDKPASPSPKKRRPVRAHETPSEPRQTVRAITAAGPSTPSRDTDQHSQAPISAPTRATLVTTEVPVLSADAISQALEAFSSAGLGGLADQLPRPAQEQGQLLAWIALTELKYALSRFSSKPGPEGILSVKDVSIGVIRRALELQEMSNAHTVEGSSIRKRTFFRANDEIGQVAIRPLSDGKIWGAALDLTGVRGQASLRVEHESGTMTYKDTVTPTERWLVKASVSRAAGDVAIEEEFASARPWKGTFRLGAKKVRYHVVERRPTRSP